MPHYFLYSLVRGVAALAISYLFALGFGLAAASSRAAERVFLPLLDIRQSIPLLGFLPGLVLGLVALFPGRNTGLELAAICMAPGAITFTFGDNSFIGGENHADFSFGGQQGGTTLKIDGKPIIVNGRLQ